MSHQNVKRLSTTSATRALRRADGFNRSMPEDVNATNAKVTWDSTVHACRGDLQKLASKAKVNRALNVVGLEVGVWQRRYVFADDDALCYEPLEAGVESLTKSGGGKKRVLWSEVTKVVPFSGSKKETNFVVCTRRRDFTFAAIDAQECERWIKQITFLMQGKPMWEAKLAAKAADDAKKKAQEKAMQAAKAAAEAAAAAKAAHRAAKAKAEAAAEAAKAAKEALEEEEADEATVKANAAEAAAKKVLEEEAAAKAAEELAKKKAEEEAARKKAAEEAAAAKKRADEEAARMAARAKAAEEAKVRAEERAKAAKAAWEGAGRNVAAKVASSRALFAKLQGVATDIVAVATARKVARKATVLRALLVLLGVGAAAATLYFAATAMVPEPVVAPAQSNNPFKPAGGIAAIVAALGALFVPKYLAPLARSLNPTSRALVTSAAALLGK